MELFNVSLHHAFAELKKKRAKMSKDLEYTSKWYCRLISHRPALDISLPVEDKVILSLHSIYKWIITVAEFHFVVHEEI